MTDKAYTSDQCTYWLFNAQSSDIDSSGGLSQDEFFAFLVSIEDPSYITDYFMQYRNFADLPWEYKVIYKTLACNCMRMGQNANCCVGSDVEVVIDPSLIIDGTTSLPRQNAVSGYEELLCQQIGFLVNTVDAPPSIQPASLSPVGIVGETKVPTQAPLQIDIAKGATIEEESWYEDETTSNSLGGGVIVGIIFAILIPFCGFCFVLTRQRKMAEERRLREFAGEAASEDHLATFDAKNDMRKETSGTKEIENANVMSEGKVVITPPTYEELKESAKYTNNEQNEESEDDGSVWPDENDKKDVEKDIVVETEQDASRSLVGSALAAMGVASTVATTMISPTSSNKEKNDTQINAFV